MMLMMTNIICIDFGLVVTLSKSDLNEVGFFVKKKYTIVRETFY